MRVVPLFCLVFLHTLLVNAAEAPQTDFVVQSWRTSEGLPANIVLEIKQAPDDRLWIATTHGLSRFDGLRFDSYLTSRLPHRFGTRIEKLDIGPDGKLWIAAEQLGAITFEDNRFSEVHTNSPALKTATTSLCVTPEGDTWLVDTRGHLFRIPARNPARLESISFRVLPDAQLIKDGRGHVWAVAPRKVSRLLGNQWVSVYESQEEIRAGAPCRSGGLWLATDGHLYKLAGNSLARLEAFPWTRGNCLVTCLFEDSRGVLWLGTSTQGLQRRLDGQITTALSTPRSIKCIAEDREGDLWLGGRGGGLVRVSRRMFNLVNLDWGLRNEFVVSLCQDKAGRVWLATEGAGLGWIQDGRWQPVGKEQGWAGYDVRCLAPHVVSGVWLATAGQGLWHWNTNRATRVSLRTDLPGGVPRSLHHARNGRLWMVLENVGLVSIDTKHLNSNSPATFIRHGAKDGLSAKRIRSMAEDKDGNFWVGDYHGGVWKFAGLNWQEIRPPSTIADAVRSLLFDDNGDLWIGTAGGGLLRIKGGEVTRISTAQGLPANEIEQMQLEKGLLWFGTSKGLFHTPMQHLIEIADKKRVHLEAVYHGGTEGLNELHFAGRQQPRSWRTDSGQLWFATANGALYFDPGSLSTNISHIKAAVDAILADGQIMTAQTLQSLRSTNRRLEFRFTAPSFSAPERVRFRYQLKGVDPDWVESSSRSAVYSSVPFGRHVFRVQASNASGVWGPVAESPVIVVQPNFWETQWFVALLAGSFAGGLAWAARRATLLRLRRKLRKLEQQHALERERARISQDIHDELGANLTSIGLLADMGVRHSGNPEALARDLTQISETARSTAGAMDAIVWAVNPRNDSLEHFANYIGQFTRDFFRPTTVRVRLKLPTDASIRPMSANVRHNLFLAVKESLNNVARHAEATEVRLSLEFGRDDLRLVVEDDGKGLPPPSGRVGEDGLCNIRARIESLGGQLRVQQAEGGGTRLTFVVALTRLNLN